MLAEGEIAQADVLQQAQRVMDGRMGGEEIHRFIHAHGQHLADVLALPARAAGLGIEARSAAFLARHFDVGQNVHLDALAALALAARAASAGCVKGKTPGIPAAHTGFGGVGEQLADGVPKADIGGRAGARRLADRCLINLQHPRNALVTLDGAAAHQRCALAATLACQQQRQIGVQHIPRQRRFARARDTGDDGDASERKARIAALQVMQSTVAHDDGRRIATHRTRRMQRMQQRPRQKASGDRRRIALQIGRRALRHDLPAEASGTRADVDHMMGAADGFFVVLDHHQGVALGLELLQRVEQNAVVARMQADGRFVQDVAHPAQVRAQLCRQTDALRLAARERWRGAIERQIAQPDLLQEVQSRVQLGQNIAGDLGVSAR